MVTRWLTDDEQRVWRALLGMTSQLRARLNRQLQDVSGLSLADYDVLVVLSETPGQRLRVFEIADALAWEQSRLSHQLARMKRRGLIKRRECLTDSRGAIIELITAGRTAIEQAAPAHVNTVRELLFDGLDQAQVSALGTVASTVLHRLYQDEADLCQ